MNTIQGTLVGLEKKLSDLSADVATLSVSHEAITTRIDTFEDASQSEFASVKYANTVLKGQVMKLTIRLNKMEAREKSNELTIAGLLARERESARDLAFSVCEVIGVDVPSTSLLNAFCLGPSQPGKPAEIMVRLANDHLCEQNLSAARNHNPSLSASDIDTSFEPTRIYINRNLPSDLYALQKATRVWAKAVKNVYSVRIWDGAVYIIM